jgi:hypothetical protein
MEVVGAVLSHELDVVVVTRVPDGFHDGQPRAGMWVDSVGLLDFKS